MFHDQLKTLLHQEPFQPFRVVLKDGRTFDIHYPKVNLLGEKFIDIGKPNPEHPDWLAHSSTIVSYWQIERIELLPGPKNELVQFHEQFKTLLCQRPFQPFRVLLKDGRTFEINYPAINLLGKKYINIGTPDSEHPDWLAVSVTVVSFDQIDRLETLLLTTGQTTS